MKYFLIFKLSFKTGLLQVKELIGLSIFLVSCITIFASIWQVSVPFDRDSLFSPVDFVWYVALNEWVLVSLPHCYEKVSEDFKTGLFSYYLIRPASYIACKFFEAAGQLFSSLLILGPVAFLTAYLWTRCCPLDMLDLLLSIGFGVVGGLVGTLGFLTVGFCRFWFHDVLPIYWIYEKFLFLLGGLFLPIQTYPLWLQGIAYAMPSFGILGGRSALVFERSPGYLLFLSVSCLAWCALFWGLSHLMMGRGLKNLMQEGG